MVDKTKIYNEALKLLGEGNLKLQTDHRGKSDFWKKWLEIKPYDGPKIKEPEIDFIAFDECSEISEEHYNKMLKVFPTLVPSLKRLNNSLLKLRKEIDKDKKVINISDYRL